MSLNSLKSLSGRLNIDPNPYVKYENPSSSGCQGIVLTRFSHCYNGSRKRDITWSIFNGIRSKVNQVI